jgi:predicted MFS family arabinose efflux permease
MSGSLADRRDPRLVVIGATVGIAAVVLLMLTVRDNLLLVAVLEALSGVVSFSVIGPQAHRLIGYAPEGGAPLVTSLNASTAYLGQFLSSIIGASLLAVVGSAGYLLPVAAVFALAAATVTWLSKRSSDRQEAPGAREADPAAVPVK